MNSGGKGLKAVANDSLQSLNTIYFYQKFKFVSKEYEKFPKRTKLDALKKKKKKVITLLLNF